MQIFAAGGIKKTLTFAAPNAIVVVAVVIALDMPICAAQVEATSEGPWNREKYTTNCVWPWFIIPNYQDAHRQCSLRNLITEQVSLTITAIIIRSAQLSFEFYESRTFHGHFIEFHFGLISHWGKNLLFIQNILISVKHEILETWILWKLWFWKGELCEKMCFFVWILWRLSFFQNVVFVQNVDFCPSVDICEFLKMFIIPNIF